MQEKVDISDCKSGEEVAAKILVREHVGLPRVVGMFAKGKFEISGKKVTYKPDR
jgi:folate-dependent phosphoribosylglycinamide formyltransferase PurN